MRRLQVVQQGELLVEREPGLALTARTRTMVLPLVATAAARGGGADRAQTGGSPGDGGKR